MSNVVIEIETGFAGAVHHLDTYLTVEEWKEQTSEEKNDRLNDAIFKFISAYAVDEKTGDIIE